MFQVQVLHQLLSHLLLLLHVKCLHYSLPLSRSPDATTSTSFTDIKNESAYYYKDVLQADQSCIAKCISSNTFGVGQSITIVNANHLTPYFYILKDHAEV